MNECPDATVILTCVYARVYNAPARESRAIRTDLYCYFAAAAAAAADE